MPDFWTINFGHFLTILVLGAGGLGFVYTMRGRLDALSERMGGAESELRKLVDVLIAQGRHDERLNAADMRQLEQAKAIAELTSRVNRLADERSA